MKKEYTTSDREIRYIKRTIKKYRNDDYYNSQQIKYLNKYLDYYLSYAHDAYNMNIQLLNILNNSGNSTSTTNNNNDNSNSNDNINSNDNNSNKFIPGVIV